MYILGNIHLISFKEKGILTIKNDPVDNNTMIRNSPDQIIRGLTHAIQINKNS